MKFKKTAAALGAASLVAIAGPALAAPPYNVAVGTFTSGSHTYTAASKGAINFTVAGPGGSVALGCTSATAGGTVTAGANATGLNVGAIGTSGWSGCIGPGSIPMTVTQVGSWSINLNGTATNPLTDTVTGYVGNVTANVTSVTPGLCSFKVTGRANGALVEPVKTGNVQDLQINQPTTGGNLLVSNVSGCFGAIANGNPASFVGVFNVSSPDGLINIKP